jgi:hypothetical protein
LGFLKGRFQPKTSLARCRAAEKSPGGKTKTKNPACKKVQAFR